MNATVGSDDVQTTAGEAAGAGEIATTTLAQSLLGFGKYAGNKTIGPDVTAGEDVSLSVSIATEADGFAGLAGPGSAVRGEAGGVFSPSDSKWRP